MSNRKLPEIWKTGAFLVCVNSHPGISGWKGQGDKNLRMNFKNCTELKITLSQY